SKIRDLKAAGADKVTLKPLVDELLSAKAKYEEVAGKPFDPPKQSEKKAKGPAQQPSKKEPGEKSKKELQKEKKKAAKKDAKALINDKVAAGGGEPGSTPGTGAVVSGSATAGSGVDGGISRDGADNCLEIRFSPALLPVVSMAACSLTGLRIILIPGEVSDSVWGVGGRIG
ncbi:unnamed protein product, partial [Choristocarpus tenellus]